MSRTLLTSVYGVFPARVLEARLRTEGIDVELRGALGGPYGLTMGDLARVDVYVAPGQVDDASLLLLVDEAEAALDPPPTRHTRITWPLWLVLVVVVAGGLAPVIRLVLG